MADRGAFVLGGLVFTGVMSLVTVLAWRSDEPVRPAEPHAFVFAPALQVHGSSLQLPLLSAPVEVCVDPAGHVVSITTSPQLPDRERVRLASRLADLQFEPYRLDGHAVAACATFTAPPPPVVLAEAQTDPCDEVSCVLNAYEPACCAKFQKQPAPPDPCDEVSCVLSNYEGACCAKFQKGSGKRAGVPDALDRAAISAGVAKVKPAVQACGDSPGGRGVIKVHVKVAPDGSVSWADATPPGPLATCVTTAIKRAHFATTVGGGSFAYPFVF